ncbi:citrate lyase subunit beta/citryl-CoA lyase [Sphingomonas jinjuensis]|uniref:Citrate lyase subunit beta/citryl-CoA lyase n=1 Tax=Sphingomonas jinjuensis TaxID=535907 RepID=A0A840FJ58_9SPHN|nr:CoA ester lyase [Sphingomonas jinjuensis]MBB4153998.1 citrate lyase subunit beta/citryl-CoA lyase [Sphingomonas jinjuensis]
MRLRSLLFVPADRPERFAKAAASGADAVILDLEDSVALANKARGREAVADHLTGTADVMRLVRINPLTTGMLNDDLAAARGADALMLPKAEGAASVAALRAAWGPDCPPILPIAAETPRGVFAFGSYADAPGLLGLTWGAEDLPAAIGAETAREPDGRYTDPYRLTRSLTLFAAHAAGVAAIETVYPAITDLDGLARYAERGARDGFTGMMAIHPTQVAPINDAFTPSAAAIGKAQRIVDAFAAQPDAGAIQLDGAMIDAPHLKQAQRLLARAGDAG